MLVLTDVKNVTKLYFLGGEDIVKRDSEEINRKAIADSSGAPVVLIFPWTSESGGKAGKYGEIMRAYFKDLGAKRIEFAELLDSLQEITEKVNASDLIYLPGGDTRLLLKRLRDSGTDSLLRKYNKVIIGNSAGALALCRDYVIVKGQGAALETKVALGIGLANFGVCVHYRSLREEYSGESLDKELKGLSEKVNVKIYAIPEQCALIYDEGNLEFVGDIYLFCKGKKTKCK